MALDVVVVQVLLDIMADTMVNLTAVAVEEEPNTTVEMVRTEVNQVAVDMPAGDIKIVF
jgi:hypothetical protein